MTQTVSRTPKKSTTVQPSAPAPIQYWQNEVSFIGRIGRDPEMNYTGGGKAITKFSLAVSQGQNKEAMWLTVQCWEELAARINEEAGVGDLVQVSGRLTQRKWENKYYHDVVAKDVTILQSKGRAVKSGSADESPLDDDELDDHPF